MGGPTDKCKHFDFTFNKIRCYWKIWSKSITWCERLSVVEVNNTPYNSPIQNAQFNDF